VFALSVVSGFAVGDGAVAQTCANPLYATVNQTVNGNTCGTNNMPTQNHGTILTPGGDSVFLVGGGPYGVWDVQVDAPPHEVFVFVCSGCGPNEECVAVAESGVANGLVSYPRDGKPYYVIVDGPGTCTDFQLTPLGPLKQDP
jgi:hypothetical protein